MRGWVALVAAGAVFAAASATSAQVGILRALTGTEPSADDASSISEEFQLDETVDVALLSALDSVGLGERWRSIGTIDPRSAGVSVDGNDIQELRDQLVADATALASFRSQVRTLTQREGQYGELAAALEAHRAISQLDLSAIQTDQAMVSEALKSTAVTRYVFGHSGQTAGENLEVLYTNATRNTLVGVAVEDLTTRREVGQAALAGLLDDVDQFEAAIAEQDSLHASIVRQLDAAAQERDRLEILVPEQLAELAESRMGARVKGLGLSLVTLDAYLHAEAVTAVTYPECALRWQAIAGIGRVESNHGRDKNGFIDATGNVTTPFLGIVLDGTVEGTVTVFDTDGGALDGDAVYDRAVGLFQFLPRSWRQVAVDATDDGLADPNNMYDGAATVAVYLCTRVSPMTEDDQLRSAYRTYNNSADYVDAVLEYVHQYDEFDVATSDQS